MSDPQPITDDDGDMIGRSHRVDADALQGVYYSTERGEGQVVLEYPDDYVIWFEPEPIAEFRWLEDGRLGVFYE